MKEIVIKLKVVVEYVDTDGNPLFKTPEPVFNTMDGDTGHGTPPPDPT